jgi:hypothetical protein
MIPEFSAAIDALSKRVELQVLGVMFRVVSIDTLRIRHSKHETFPHALWNSISRQTVMHHAG